MSEQGIDAVMTSLLACCEASSARKRVGSTVSSEEAAQHRLSQLSDAMAQTECEEVMADFQACASVRGRQISRTAHTAAGLAQPAAMTCKPSEPVVSIIKETDPVKRRRSIIERLGWRSDARPRVGEESPTEPAATGFDTAQIPSLVARIAELEAAADLAAAENLGAETEACFPDAAIVFIKRSYLIMKMNPCAAAGRWAIARERFPEFVDGWVHGAQVLAKEGRYEEADAIIHSALGKFPDNYAVFACAGYAAGARARWDEAVELWAKAAAILPEKEEAKRNLHIASNKATTHCEWPEDRDTQQSHMHRAG